MIYKEFAKFLSDNGFDSNQNKYIPFKPNENELLIQDNYGIGDRFICLPQENIYEHYRREERCDEYLSDVYESEEECVVAMLALIYEIQSEVQSNSWYRWCYPCLEKINRETLREMLIKAQIDSFAKWLNKYSEKIGIKYVQYDTSEDNRLKPGECGIVFDNTTNEFVFACQDYPTNENESHSTFYTVRESSITWLVKNEKRKLRYHLRKNIAVGTDAGTEENRWSLYYDTSDNNLVYVFTSSIGIKYRYYILSQHPYGPTLYIDDYDKKINKSKTIVIDGIGFPISLDFHQEEWQEFGNELFDLLSTHEIIECPHSNSRWLFDDSWIPDGENYEVACKNCKKQS